MKLDTALLHIRTCRDRMDAQYLKPVFDEWVVVSLISGKVDILAYEGPRSDGFKQKLHSDSAPLYASMEGHSYEPGDFEFVQNAKGSRYDACVKLGDNRWLLCNNTYGSISDIRQDPRWRQAQKPFVDLSEEFRGDPLD